MNQASNSPNEGTPSKEIDRFSPPSYALEKKYHDYTDDYEVNLLSYWRVLMKRKWLAMAIFVLCVAASILITFTMQRKYTSVVSLMPITSSKGGGLADMASQLSSVPLLGKGLGGLTEQLGSSKTKELVNILESTTLTENIIKRFNLMPVLYAKQYIPSEDRFKPGFPAFLKPIPVLEDGVKKFINKIAKVKADKKTGLITIKVTLKDPVLAAKVANAMVISLQNFINDNSLTEEKRNRIFIEEQVVKNRAKLLRAGKELNQFYSQGKISSVAPQLDVDVGSYEPLGKVLEDFIKSNDEASLNGTDPNQPEKTESVSETVTGVPGQVYLEYLTLDRTMLMKTHGLLTQQYELAKIEEAKEDLAFNVLDRGHVMERSSSPNLMINVFIGTFAGFFLAIFMVYFLEYIEKLKAKEAVE